MFSTSELRMPARLQQNELVDQINSLIKYGNFPGWQKRPQSSEFEVAIPGIAEGEVPRRLRFAGVKEPPNTPPRIVTDTLYSHPGLMIPEGIRVKVRDRRDAAADRPSFEVKIKVVADGIKASVEHTLENYPDRLPLLLREAGWVVAEERRRLRESWEVRVLGVNAKLDLSTYSPDQRELDIELLTKYPVKRHVAMLKLNLVAKGLGFPLWRLTTKGYSDRLKHLQQFGPY